MWWYTVTQGGEVKGKLANAVGSKYSSHYLGTWCIQHYYRWCAHLGCQQSTELTPPGRFKRTRPFRWKTKSVLFACAITFQPAFSSHNQLEFQMCFPEAWVQYGISKRAWSSACVWVNALSCVALCMCLRLLETFSARSLCRFPVIL